MPESDTAASPKYIKSKPHPDYDCKNYLLPRVLDQMISNEIIEAPIIKLLMSNHIYHAKDFINCFTIEISSSNSQQTFGTSNKLLEDEVGSNLVKDCQCLGMSKSGFQSDSLTCDQTQITQNISCSFNDQNDEDSTFIESLGTNDSKYIQVLLKKNIDEEFAERLYKWFILAFLVKYEQAGYENIKKLSKFENALINFVNQQFQSKKFNKLYGQYTDILDVGTVAKMIINFLVDRKCILVSEGKIEHYEDRLREEKELFDQYI